VVLQVVSRRQFAAPRIVHNYHRTLLSGLHNCLHFASILHAFPSPLYKQQIDRTLVIFIAALQERVGREEALETILC
jgi:hypothetical protein